MKYFFSLVFILYSTMSLSDEFDCNDAINTHQINYCAGLELTAAELEMNTYLSKSKIHNSYDQTLIESIDIAQQAWSTYIDAHCGSIYTMWREGTIRDVMHLNCKTKITQQRTHEIWLHFLTYMDSTPPLLPEPTR